MNNLQLHFIKKLNKSSTTGISMRLRLFMFLALLVLTMAAGIVIILLVTGTFTAGTAESEQELKNELSHASGDISTQYGQLSVQAVEFSRELSQKIEMNLNKQNTSFARLSENPEQIETLISDLFETTYYSLEKSKSSGAFLILNTTVNPALKGSENSKAGLYIKNMEPNVISALAPNFTILRGFSSIGRENSINLHTQWSMEFDIHDADYYNLPMEAAREDIDLPLSKLYYWSDPLILPDTSEEVMLCSVPLIDSNYNLYGVCGFEISAMLFKLLHTPENNVYSRMFCMLSPYQSSSIAINRSMFAGGYSIKDISKESTECRVKENSDSFTTYTLHNSCYYGYQTPVQLYAEGSPFFKENWVTAVLVPKEDIVDSIAALNITLICLLCILVTFGIIISIVFSNKYLKPISQGIEAIKTASGTDEVPKTNVQEIDDLIHYLSEYKKELGKKVEQDKYQITLLEEFVSKTKSLTPAERSVFNLIVSGLSSKEIADELFVSINTIKTHNKHIFAKLNIASREELLLYVTMLKEIGLELK